MSDSDEVVRVAEEIVMSARILEEVVPVARRLVAMAKRPSGPEYTQDIARAAGEWCGSTGMGWLAMEALVATLARLAASGEYSRPEGP